MQTGSVLGTQSPGTEQFSPRPARGAGWQTPPSRCDYRGVDCAAGLRGWRRIVSLSLKRAGERRRSLPRSARRGWTPSHALWQSNWKCLSPKHSCGVSGFAAHTALRGGKRASLFTNRPAPRQLRQALLRRPQQGPCDVYIRCLFPVRFSLILA